MACPPHVGGVRAFHQCRLRSLLGRPGHACAGAIGGGAGLDRAHSPGDEAPLAAAATNDALLRLQALGRAAPGTTDVAVLAVEGTPAHRVRVAHGLPLNDYLGTGIAFKPHRASPADTWQYHLLLVDRCLQDGRHPGGAEFGRNMLQGTWEKRHQLSKAEQTRTRFAWMENRPMRIPEGPRQNSLHMVGWVQNAQGEVVAAARSACR